jgi:hypothetical protein
MTGGVTRLLRRKKSLLDFVEEQSAMTTLLCHCGASERSVPDLPSLCHRELPLLRKRGDLIYDSLKKDNNEIASSQKELTRLRRGKQSAMTILLCHCEAMLVSSPKQSPFLLSFRYAKNLKRDCFVTSFLAMTGGVTRLPRA